MKIVFTIISFVFIAGLVFYLIGKPSTAQLEVLEREVYEQAILPCV